MQTLALISAAHIHTPRFIQFMTERDDIHLKYVWDDDEARGKKAAEKAGASFISDLNVILDDKELTGAVVCSETIKHEELIMPILKAKKHLFVEKPLGFAAADAARIAAAINEADVLFSTGFFQRSLAYNQFLKAQIEAGHFGEITRVRHSNCHQGSLDGWFDGEWRWMADPKQAGVGAFGDLGAHSLDILIWLLGDVEAVTGSIKSVTGRYDDCDEVGEALLKFKNGCIATLAAGWVDAFHPFTLQINGTEGNALIINKELYFQSKHVEGSSLQEVWTDLPEAKGHAFEIFLDALSDPTVKLISASETAYRNLVMEAIYKASDSASWVTI